MRLPGETCLPAAHDLVNQAALVCPLLALAERQLIEAVDSDAMADIEDSIGHLILFGDDLVVAVTARTTADAGV